MVVRVDEESLADVLRALPPALRKARRKVKSPEEAARLTAEIYMEIQHQRATEVFPGDVRGVFDEFPSQK
jgi:hypothetical protein